MSRIDVICRCAHVNICTMFPLLLLQLWHVGSVNICLQNVVMRSCPQAAIKCIASVTTCPPCDRGLVHQSQISDFSRLCPWVSA